MRCRTGIAARLYSRASRALNDRRLVEAAALRFLSMVELDERTGCLIWLGAPTHHYGQFVLWDPAAPREQRRIVVIAHRFAFALWHGSVDPALDVDHSCNNKRCVGAAHLEQLTHAENIARRDRHLGDWLVHDERGRFTSNAA